MFKQQEIKKFNIKLTFKLLIVSIKCINLSMNSTRIKTKKLKS